MNKLFIVGILILVSGCQTTQIVPYQPEGKEQFIFNEDLDESKRGVGYANSGEFCPELSGRECTIISLPYKDYKNTKGYFELDGPYYFGSFKSLLYYPVVLENGKKLYFNSFDSLGKYKQMNRIIPLNLHNEIKSLEQTRLTKNSDLYVISSRVRNRLALLTLSNGQEVSLDHYKKIKSITAKYPLKKLSELLTYVNIEYDHVDDKTIISTNSYRESDYIQLILDVDEKANVILKYKINYYSDHWIFANHFKVSMGGFKWNSHIQEFNRDNSGGNVWEWRTNFANKDSLIMLDKIANSSTATIRLYGDQYYHDFNVENGEQISKLLSLYKAMIK